MMNKKAVSPLIATVLLIAFAVALGAIVMNWGESFVRETQETAEEASEGRLECTMMVDFEVINANYWEESGTSPDANLTVLIRNAGDREIEEFVAQIFTNTTKGARAVYNESVLESLDVAEIVFDLTDYLSDKGYDDGLIDLETNVTEVRIIPRIDTGAPEGPVSCTTKYATIKAEDMNIEEG